MLTIQNNIRHKWILITTWLVKCKTIQMLECIIIYQNLNKNEYALHWEKVNLQQTVCLCTRYWSQGDNPFGSVNLYNVDKHVSLYICKHWPLWKGTSPKFNVNQPLCIVWYAAVSYTHLDVYKRQLLHHDVNVLE